MIWIMNIVSLPPLKIFFLMTRVFLPHSSPLRALILPSRSLSLASFSMFYSKSTEHRCKSRLGEPTFWFHPILSFIPSIHALSTHYHTHLIDLYHTHRWVYFQWSQRSCQFDIKKKRAQLLLPIPISLGSLNLQL